MSLFPSSRRGMWWRFALGAVIVIVFTAATTAVAGLLQFKQLASDIGGQPAINAARVTIPEPGDPQTILIIGSDHRAQDPISAANSDTMMLVRLNAASSTINVISIPRDLKVDIPLPGGGLKTAKLNASYPLGGPNLVVKTLQRDVFPGLRVNHIVDINFRGFRELVNAIGCVYTDVDHRYYNQNIGTPDTNYSNIDIQAGYQKLCDENALSYVRYRHTDTDLVRNARQQSFIRDAKDQYGQTRLISNRDRLLRIFGRHTETDSDLHTTDGLINLFNLVAFADGHSIRQIHFPANLMACTATAPCYVTVDPAKEAHVYNEFMAATGPAPAVGAPPAGGPRRPAGPAPPPPANVQDDSADGKSQVAALGRPTMPFFYPRMIANDSTYEPPTPGAYPRSYNIRDPAGVLHPAYRLVLAVNNATGEYYGVQGTTWTDAPILSSPNEIRNVGGRQLELHFDGARLQMVAWRSSGAVYWISNTLSRKLSNSQMLAIAASLTRG